MCSPDNWIFWPETGILFMEGYFKKVSKSELLSTLKCYPHPETTNIIISVNDKLKGNLS